MKKRLPIGKYLLYSYLYYQCDLSLVEDAEYDAICGELLDRYDEVQLSKHPHKHLIDRDALKAGSCYHLAYNAYPFIVVSLAKAEMNDPGYLARLEQREPPKECKTAAVPQKSSTLLDFC